MEGDTFGYSVFGVAKHLDKSDPDKEEHAWESLASANLASTNFDSSVCSKGSEPKGVEPVGEVDEVGEEFEDPTHQPVDIDDEHASGKPTDLDDAVPSTQ